MQIKKAFLAPLVSIRRETEPPRPLLPPPDSSHSRGPVQMAQVEREARHLLLPPPLQP